MILWGKGKETDKGKKLKKVKDYVAGIQLWNWPSMYKQSNPYPISLIRYILIGKRQQTTYCIQAVNLQEEGNFRKQRKTKRSPLFTTVLQTGTMKRRLSMLHPFAYPSLSFTWEHRNASGWNRPCLKSQSSSVVMRQCACIPTQHGRPVILHVRWEELTFSCASWQICADKQGGKQEELLLLMMYITRLWWWSGMTGTDCE